MLNHVLLSPARRAGWGQSQAVRRSNRRLGACSGLALRIGLSAGAPLLWAAVAALPAQAASGRFFSPVVKLAAGVVERQAVGAPVRVIKVERGGRVALPMANVTRVITDDVDVARAAFEGSQAFVEGVSSGSSVLEVQTADGRVQKITIEVVAPGSLGTVPATSQQPEQAIVGTIDLSSPRVPAPNGGAGTPSPTPPIVPAGPNVKAPNPHQLSLRVGPADENAGQALVTVTYQNTGSEAQDVTIHSPLDPLVSYVTGSATGSPRFDSGAQELTWTLKGVEGGGSRSVAFRVEPLDRGNQVFQSIASLEGGDGGYASTKSTPFSFVTTPLLTVFALPDRILAGRVVPVMVDVHGAEAQAAIDRQGKMGVLSGRGGGLFYPDEAAQRAEYVVMTLRGLNLRDVRDVTAIKYVLGRQSIVNLSIKNSAGQVVANIVRNQSQKAGEHTEVWDGRSGSGYVPAGRYSYVCTARDNAKGDTTTLSGIITVIPQTPVKPLVGQNTFVDVKDGDWFAGYLALAEKQNLVKGYGDKTFHPTRPISRVEATTIVVRALGLEDLARTQAGKDLGFLDYQDIPAWATGYVNVAVTAKGRVMKGYPSNFFLPMKSLRRDEAALIVQRLIDRDANRRISVSGAMVPGAVVTINNRTVEAADDGAFQFVIDQDSANPITIAVTDSRPSRQ